MPGGTDVASPRFAGSYYVNGVLYQDGMQVIQIGADYRGPYPNTLYLAFLSATGTNAGDVLYTSPDVSAYNVHEFQGVANLFTVEVSLDGTNWSGAQALEDGASTTPATRVAASANQTSVYYLYGKFSKIRIKQSGAGAASARGAHSVR